MSTSTTLTIDDLRRTLADERHLGWGFACCQDLPRTTLERLERSVVAVANELGMDYEALFHWSNSKHGRWLHDAVYGNSKPPTRETVRTLLNAKAVAASWPEPRYTVQVHGEWSGREDVTDEDFEASTMDEARRIIRDEVPAGVIYCLYDGDSLIEEATR